MNISNPPQPHQAVSTDTNETKPFGCKCTSLARHLTGDGCDECNPEMAAEIERQNAEDEAADLASPENGAAGVPMCIYCDGCMETPHCTPEAIARLNASASAPASEPEGMFLAGGSPKETLAFLRGEAETRFEPASEPVVETPLIELADNLRREGGVHLNHPAFTELYDALTASQATVAELREEKQKYFNAFTSAEADFQKLRATVARMEGEKERQRERIVYLEGATNHAGGTPLSHAVAGLRKIIEMNRQQAFDQYGDYEKAETWSCVKVAREALASLKQEGRGA